MPSWVIAVNAAPGSAPVPSSEPTMRMCALLETGMNSVSPWTMPRMMALTVSMMCSGIRRKGGGLDGRCELGVGSTRSDREGCHQDEDDGEE